MFTTNSIAFHGFISMRNNVTSYVQCNLWSYMKGRSLIVGTGDKDISRMSIHRAPWLVPFFEIFFMLIYFNNLCVKVFGSWDSWTTWPYWSLRITLTYWTGSEFDSYKDQRADVHLWTSSHARKYRGYTTNEKQSMPNSKFHFNDYQVLIRNSLRYLSVELNIRLFFKLQVTNVWRKHLML